MCVYVCVCDRRSGRVMEEDTYRINLPPATENEIHRLITLAVEHHQGGIQPSLGQWSTPICHHCHTSFPLTKLALQGKI